MRPRHITEACQPARMDARSLVIGRDHESFPNRGGFHHYYANDRAVAGYAAGTFPDGSIVVDEAVFMKDGRGAPRAYCTRVSAGCWTSW